MKKIADKVIVILVVISGFFITGIAQEIDSTGLPGDHFSLDGALELFKNAESPEAFEKALNTENNTGQSIRYCICIDILGAKLGLDGCAALNRMGARKILYYRYRNDKRYDINNL